MSVIVYRDGVLASDSRAYSGSLRPIGRKRKTRRLDCGTLVGVTASVPGILEWILEWYGEGAEPLAPLPAGDYDRSFSLLAVRPDGQAFFAYDALALSGPLAGDYFAIGSGASYALGALYHGASAEEAVAAAVGLDPLCGGPVDALRHAVESDK